MKVFTSITAYSGFHFDFQKNYWVRGPGYTWNNFKEARKGMTITETSFTQYSALTSIWVLFGNIILFSILTFYFDNILESNRGRSESPLFFLNPSYWGYKPKKVQKGTYTISEIIQNQNQNHHN